MRLLKFPPVNPKEEIGLLELLWTSVVMSPFKDMKKKEHKVNKRLKSHLREITQFKDKDEDSRISKEGSQDLIIEEDEYELLQKHLDSHSFTSRISEQVSDLYDIVDNASLYTLPKPE